MCIIGLTLYGKDESDKLDKMAEIGVKKKEIKNAEDVVELTSFVFKD